MLTLRVTDQDAGHSGAADAATPGDVVFVKGSQHRTWPVADWLREAAGEPSRGEVVARVRAVMS